MTVDFTSTRRKDRRDEQPDSTPASMQAELLALQEAASIESARHEFIADFRWPEGVRVAVNFTCDYDAMLLRRVFEEPALQLAKGEFGGRVGALRLVKLFDKHDVKATFFVPGRICELYPASLRAMVASGHELADHMWEHQTPVAHRFQVDHIEKTAEALSRFTGHRPRGTRSFYPNALLRQAGHVYNSHGSASLMPYYTGDADGGHALVELPFHFAIDDAQFFTFGWIGSAPEAQHLSDPERVLELWWDAFMCQYERGGYLNICLHPYVSGRAMRIAMLDELILRIKKLDGVWFPTCETVARYCLDRFPPRKLRT
ncbi:MULTISPECIES: polysaccharide deacetylase family protein [unclassified Variovorax]|uniref:polysaccharide deacetylase family protein n=1 Tax=unclassified Variovorax TaxID=663243 RepID=UPI0008CA199D|nr:MULTISPECIES: polysaccharide deacetylase family protein [unclassified Variovorax]SEK17270.1 Polysaccharide deacetylase [Variovorax sp. OK202]SFE77082.1 Polysaccharide deacetylase [Variovorax sp. OK212]